MSKKLSRRVFLKAGVGAASLALLPTHAIAAQPTRPQVGNPLPMTFDTPLGPQGPEAALQRLSEGSGGKTPTVKKFTAAWVRTLQERGAPQVYAHANTSNFEYIGMPISGIGTGQIYLGGDGKLWWWDVFNNRASTWPNDHDDAFIKPYHENDPTDTHQNAIEQGFALQVVAPNGTLTRTLDKKGFADIAFTGQYPLGKVQYRDPHVPVMVDLEAFSPFIPLNIDDSSLPAVLMEYTVTNTSKALVTGAVAGWLENAICIESTQTLPGTRQSRVTHPPGAVLIEHTAANVSQSPVIALGKPQPPRVYEDWSSGTYAQWTVTGTAFGAHPAKKGEIYHPQGVHNEQGDYMADSLLDGKDDATGTLTSKPFTITRPYINVLLGGGNHPGITCVNLLINGKAMHSATGQNSEILNWSAWNVSALIGNYAQLQIVDNESGGWGHIMVDNIEFADTPRVVAGGISDVTAQRDFGTMALAALGTKATGAARVDLHALPHAAFAATGSKNAAQDFSADPASPLIGSIAQSFSLAPGESATLTFVIAYHFPNPLDLGLKTDMRREYVVRFGSASDVVAYFQQNLPRLAAQTRLWNATWYDSTLPYWFLDRTFVNTAVLATATAFRLADGRFYGYEGMYSCPGTCTHVWGYVQAMGRLFPALERAIMEQDYLMPGIGINDNGGIPARSDLGDNVAVDGQSDAVLRCLLHHQYSPDMRFLRRNYPDIKRALEYLRTANDPDGTGTLIGSQHNTLDAEYFTRNAWLSLNYNAALQAMAAMANEMGDLGYAQTLREIAVRGTQYVETHLFNGEYFYQEKDPKYPKTTGTYDGCEYGQLVGQNWAYQVGLGPVVSSEKAITALNSIWRYSFTTDVGPYTKQFGTGRPFVLPGDGGIIGCTWPRGDDSINVAYLSECQSGFEYVCSAAMLWEGLVDKGLAHIRTVHDRYDAAKRNPYNEVEAGSHYSRSMASYGLFTAMCGFEYHGPHGEIAFFPRLTPEDFRAPFTVAEGWGTFAQKRAGTHQYETLTVNYGRLSLRSLAFAVSHDAPVHVAVTAGGKAIPASATVAGRRLTIRLAADTLIHAGQSVRVEIKAA